MRYERSPLNRVLGVLACSRALRAYVLACSRVYVLACSRAWRACVLSMLECLRAWRAWGAFVLACLTYVVAMMGAWRAQHRCTGGFV